MSKTRSTTKQKSNEETTEYERANDKIPLEKILDKKLNPIDKKLEEILTSITFLSAKYDELVKKVDTLEDKNKGLEVENKRLNDSVRQLELQVQQQAESISEIEQYSRRDCLEIRGIPVETNEETDKIVQA
ncbi:Hypothetical predicted protein, partial [Paramuricea clavata]